MDISRHDRVFIAGVGDVDHPVPNEWSACNQDQLWFRNRPRRFNDGDHVFALGAGRRSAVLGLFEVTRSCPRIEPQKNESGDAERWPWSIGARALATVPTWLAKPVDGVRTPRGTANLISDKRKITKLYEALDPPGSSSRR